MSTTFFNFFCYFFGFLYHNGIYHNIYVFIHSNHTIYSNTFLQFLCIICYKNKNDTLFLMHTSRIKRHFYYRLYLSCLLIFIPGILIFKCIYNRIYSTNYNKPSSWHSCNRITQISQKTYASRIISMLCRKVCIQVQQE